MGTDDPVNTIPIGEGQGGKTEALGLFHKLIGMARPFEERKVALAPERNVHISKLSAVSHQHSALNTKYD
jgi:hypothetical protein